MPRQSYHSLVMHAYFLHMGLRDLISPAEDVDDAAKQLESDIKILKGIKQNQYLRGCTRVIKSGQLHLAWNYAWSPEDRQGFINMLRVSPSVFQVLLHLIEEHPAFQNNFNNSQKPVEIQLATTLYCMRRYGNGASLEDVA
jgi:hypothetical protein